MLYFDSVWIYTPFTAQIGKHCGAIQYYWAEETSRLEFSSGCMHTPAGFRIKQKSSNCDKYALDSIAHQPNSHINNYINVNVAFPCRCCPSPIILLCEI